MPYTGPGERQSLVATKATKHGAAVVEYGHPGIAAKSTQAAGAYPNAANALAAQNIAVGEEMVVFLTGIHEVASSAITGAVSVGTPLYIVAADNTLTTTASGNVKFGRVSEVDSATGRVLVNLNLRDTI
jgi:hypothetical protein